jgi:alpha-tubulin suppressor-like RCC1 family protein
MGYNNSGQLGNGTTTDAHTPINVAINVVAAAAGYYHSLFVKSDGTLWAMGNNSYGELGNGTTSNTNLPVSVASNVVAVAAGYYHSLFVKTDGTLWAMGYNNYGQLGNGTTIYYTNWPVSVAINRLYGL